jgi:hypothetical protein
MLKIPCSTEIYSKSNYGTGHIWCRPLTDDEPDIVEDIQAVQKLGVINKMTIVISIYFSFLKVELLI